MKKKRMNLYKYTTWTSLWRWRPTTLLGDMPEKTLSSSVVKASCALARARPTSSQTLDERESALFFPLSATRYFFRRRVISSVEVARDAVFVVSMSRVVGVTETPFSTTRTVLASRLERGSFFLALIFEYIPWLNFVVIPSKGKNLFKKIKNK